MAARRKRKRRVASKRCQIKIICGKKRRICRDAKGRIKTNTAVGKSTTKRRKSSSKKRKASSGKLWKRVSRKAAVRQSGRNKGTLKPGCKFTKNGGAMCLTAAGKRVKWGI